MILAIDPGTTESGWVLFGRDLGQDAAVKGCGIADNGDLFDGSHIGTRIRHVAIEKFACYGMPIGQETIDAIEWRGRFVEKAALLPWYPKIHHVLRREVKLHLCGSAKAKDANVRQALIDRFGPGKTRAVGTLKNRGPLYGVSSHIWAALAIAVYVMDKIE